MIPAPSDLPYSVPASPPLHRLLPLLVTTRGVLLPAWYLTVVIPRRADPWNAFLSITITPFAYRVYRAVVIQQQRMFDILNRRVSMHVHQLRDLHENK